MSNVNDIIDGIKHRLPDRTNIYPALNRAVTLISKRLFYHKASMIQGSLSVSISADSDSGSLPDDFWGLINRPYKNGETYFLKPVPDQMTELSYTTNSVPTYYKIVGSTIKLYPGSSSAMTVNGEYWQRPTKLSKPTDTMPFKELFDDAIQEALIQIYSNGGENAGVVMNILHSAVDSVVPYTEKKAPVRFEDNTNFDNMIEGDW